MNYLRKIQTLMKIMLILAVVLLSKRGAEAADEIKVSYHNKQVKEIGQTVSVVVNGNKLPLGNTPGLEFIDSKKNEIYMVPAADVFKDGLGLKFTKSGKRVTLSNGSTVVKMTIGSRNASVNGKKKTLPFAPTSVKYKKANKTKLLVPARFLAAQLGLAYTWTNQSKKAGTIYLSRPDCEYFDWEGEGIEIPLEPDIPKEPEEENGEAENPSEPSDNEEGSRGEADNEEDGGGEADNDSQEGLNTASAIKDASNNRENKAFEEDKSKESITAFGITQDTEFNYISRMKGSYKNGRDIVLIETGLTMDAVIKETKKQILITISNIKGTLENSSYEVSNIASLKKVTLSVKNDKAVISLWKRDNAKYFIQKGDDFVNVLLGTGRVKIAVDCGHGADTPGKRTPPLPISLDFDGDGVIDARKGSSIKEHVFNVGVGKYLVKELERCGFRVYKSAFGDRDIPLSQRQSNIRSAGCDYSVSIHFNAMGNGKKFNKTQGTGVFYHRSNPKDSKKLSNIVLRNILKGTPQRSIGANGKHNFAMCDNQRMGTKASLLVECAFMTNLYEVEYMAANEEYWKETASELAKAFCEYTGYRYN